MKDFGEGHFKYPKWVFSRVGLTAPGCLTLSSVLNFLVVVVVLVIVLVVVVVVVVVVQGDRRDLGCQ